MSLTKLTTDLENIQALSDKPNEIEGLTADELKAKFDKAGNDIKTYINDTLTTETDTALGLKLAAATKASGADVIAGTEDTKYVTAKAIADAGVNTRIKSKIISLTRNGVADTADVSYTGVGFQPTSIMALMSTSGSAYCSEGYSDSAKTSLSKYQTGTGTTYVGSNLIMYSDQVSFAQAAVVKSYDADGFTLTWTKTASPAANTMTCYLICYR